MRSFLFILTGAVCIFAGHLSYAQTQHFTIRNGQVEGDVPRSNGGKLQISEDHQLLFKASRYLVNGDYKSAESLYSEAISMNPRNIDAYLQRGIARRELKDEVGMASDGRTAVVLANQAVALDPRDSNLYYQRSMGLRLLHRFQEAKRDMEYAIRISGKSNWVTDLKAIELEEKMVQ